MNNLSKNKLVILRRFIWALFIFSASFLFVSAGSVSSDIFSVPQVSVGHNKYVVGEVLIKYKKNKVNLETTNGQAKSETIFAPQSIEKKGDIITENISLFKISDGMTVEEKVAELRNDPNIELVQPNYTYFPQDNWDEYNDTNKGLLYALRNTGQYLYPPSYYGTVDADLDVPEAWEINEGTNATITVAVIDNGADYTHPDLVENMWDGTDCKDDGGNYLGGCMTGFDFYDDDKLPLPTMSDPIPAHGTT